MSGLILLARCALAGGIVVALGQVSIQAQQPDRSLSLGPEAWWVVAGALITIGVNLEQIRRTRSDVREMREEYREVREELKAESSDRTTQKATIDLRLQHIEDVLVFVAGHKRRDDPNAKG